MNLAEAKRRLTIPLLWAMLGLPEEPDESCCSPFREDNHPSFSIYAEGTRWHDHATGEGGDAVDFLARAVPGLSKKACCRKFLELAVGRPVVVDALPTAVAGGRSPTHGHGDPGRAATSKKPRTAPCLPEMFAPEKVRPTSSYDSWLDRLAKLRHVSRAAVDLARQRGLLQFCTVKLPGYWYPESFDPLWIKKPCEELAWVVTDGRRVNAQMRFLDGSTWDHLPPKPTKMGKGPKAKTWQGCWAAWPIGASEIEAFSTVMLVEGGPDLLAACHFIAAAGRQDSVGVVAMMGAGMSIPEEALPLLAGKRIRLYPDVDEAGRKAAERWGDQLRAAGAEVDAFELSGLRKADGTAVKDLNDCCRIHPDDAAELEGLLP